jgi:hypothetical protein
MEVGSPSPAVNRSSGRAWQSNSFLLSEAQPPKDASLRLRVDLADRNILSFHQPMAIPNKTLEADNGFAFLSEPYRIKRLLDHGISGQTRFQNNTSSPFGYATLDGFDIPMPLVRAFDRPRESIESIELFTDGYFKPALTADVAAWEAAFADVERIDPEKMDAYPSVKGTAGRMRTDDRPVVIVHL